MLGELGNGYIVDHQAASGFSFRSIDNSAYDINGFSNASQKSLAHFITFLFHTTISYLYISNRNAPNAVDGFPIHIPQRLAMNSFNQKKKQPSVV